MDGVLFDTEKVAKASWLEVNKTWKIPTLEEQYALFIGRNYQDGIALTKELYGQDFDSVRFFEECHRCLYDKLNTEGVPLKEGTREILAYLKEKNIPVAICSGTDSSRVRKNLENTGLESYFNAIIGGDKIVHGKPHPECYLLACKALHEKPENCMGIEDSPNGIRASHAAGLFTVMVPDLAPATEELRVLSDRVEDSLLSLLTYIKTIL